MTINYIIYFDEILIRPSCINKKIELRLVDKKITIDIFRFIFKPIESDISFLEDV
jgi:hypothetical protein